MTTANNIMQKPHGMPNSKQQQQVDDEAGK
jgi:hypothetical protein